MANVERPRADEEDPKAVEKCPWAEVGTPKDRKRNPGPEVDCFRVEAEDLGLVEEDRPRVDKEDP
jgi:hypothetical protein